MIGVLLISHGAMCRGMYETLKLFHGEELKQIAYLELKLDTDLEEYKAALKSKLECLDDGSGVIVLSDIIGGTPANQTAELLCKRILLVTGMNLPLLLEVCSKRLQVKDVEDIEIRAILGSGREGMLCLNDCLEKYEEEIDRN